MLAAVLGKEIRLEMDLDDNLWPVFSEASPWRETILNLAMNARDAMPDGGVFSLSTSRAVLDDDNEEPGLPHGRYAHLIVRDTGTGMSAETQQHAFEPHYSTKSRAKNSGLGLSSVQQVVRQCGGGIRLTSTPGKGVRFDIFIPAQENIQAAAQENGCQDNSPDNSQKDLLLLVEDNDELRTLIQDFLTLRGYEVLACPSAEAALSHAGSFDRRLDLIISDVLLPDLSGEHLVEQLRQQYPEAKVIFMSGDEHILTTNLATEETVNLQKPFSLQQLAAAVSHLLANTRSNRP
jgi:CheY-like chemotaxis protein